MGAGFGLSEILGSLLVGGFSKLCLEYRNSYKGLAGKYYCFDKFGGLGIGIMKFKERFCVIVGCQKVLRSDNGSGLCKSHRTVVWKKFHADRKALHDKRYRDSHPEKMKILKKKWRASEKCRRYMHDYFESHKNDLGFKEKMCRYRKEHWREFSVYNMRWMHHNPDKVKLYRKNYARLHPEKISFKSKRRCIRLKSVLGSHTFEEWDKLRSLTVGVCPSCGRFVGIERLTEDHVVPVSRNGTDFIENIQPLCGSCNSRKRDKIVRFFYSPLSHDVSVMRDRTLRGLGDRKEVKT